MYAIIVGAGVVAQALASRISEDGGQLALVVESHEAAEQLADEFPRALVIHGSGTDETALRDARAQECDAFYAVEEDDSRTIVACLLARERFNIPRVVALSSACQDAPAFSALSINTVCEPSVVVDALLAAV